MAFSFDSCSSLAASKSSIFASTASNFASVSGISVRCFAFDLVSLADIRLSTVNILKKLSHGHSKTINDNFLESFLGESSEPPPFSLASSRDSSDFLESQLIQPRVRHWHQHFRNLDRFHNVSQSLTDTQAFKAASISFTVDQAIFTVNVSNNLKVSEIHFSSKRIAREPLPGESALLF